MPIVWVAVKRLAHARLTRAVAYDCTNYGPVTFLFGGPFWRWPLEAGILRGYGE